MKEQHIELTIDKLVLEGFPAHQRRYLIQAIEAEISRLFTEQGIPSSLTGGGEMPVLNAGNFTYSPHLKSEALGKNIAQSLYKGFSNEKRNSTTSHR